MGQFGQPPGDLGLAHPGGADHDDVLGRDLVPEVLGDLLAAPAVAQGDGHRFLGVLLPHDIFVQLRHDFPGSEMVPGARGAFSNSIFTSPFMKLSAFSNQLSAKEPILRSRVGTAHHLQLLNDNLVIGINAQRGGDLHGLPADGRGARSVWASRARAAARA